MVLYNVVKNFRNSIDGDFDGESFIDDVIETIGYYADLVNKMRNEHEGIDAANHFHDFCRILNRPIYPYKEDK